MTAINEMLQQPFGQAIGWALLQFVWQGTLIALLTAALLAALRRSGPDVRYVVSTIALALMLTMPVVTVVQTLAATSPVWEETAGSLNVATTSAAEVPAPVAPAVASTGRGHAGARRSRGLVRGRVAAVVRVGLARGRGAVDAAAVQRLDVGAANEVARRPAGSGGPADCRRTPDAPPAHRPRGPAAGIDERVECRPSSAG